MFSLISCSVFGFAGVLLLCSVTGTAPGLQTILLIRTVLRRLHQGWKRREDKTIRLMALLLIKGMQCCANSPLCSTTSVRPDISMPEQGLGTLAPASGNNERANGKKQTEARDRLSVQRSSARFKVQL